MFQTIYKSPIGLIEYRIEGQYTTHLKFISHKKNNSQNKLKTYCLPEEKAIAKLLCEELDQYFQGKLKSFTIPISWHEAPSFTQEVWQELMNIPYGSLRSYQQIAENIGRPRAQRAVGSANAKNNLAILVPCHRVVRSDGSLGGYAYGQAIKKQLLELERGKLT